jgi:hypothetical protein
MSHVSPMSESTPQRTVSVVVIAILLIFVEASWKSHSTNPASTAAARHVVISNDERAPDHVVYRAVDDRTVAFSLKAGDSCVYIEDANSAGQASTTGNALVPVFCPARGAGWAPLSVMTQSEPGWAR